ncbi:phage antirepressor KilAC domain-containing protein [Chromobacterium haemolyticum]|uniref:phage antirepressor KilAC domain-containing protein n=1 Tax=Chromobacterium haemolyticum TaxID=394935 RepID=UPI000D3238ED|nr:phage regulatory protein/antirepressor Ant [Chromobacterium haemolyticum]PTU70756.1 hypothetical protein DBB33_15520 [Chromobacterium haemolyticum]
MNLTTLNSAQPLTMSSREIADLCDKRHDHVMRDIRNMLSDLKITDPKFGGSYQDSTGRALPCFNLDKELSMTLVAGYNVVLRNRIIKRWMELEERAASPALPDFSNPAAAARAWAEQFEQRQLVEEQKVLLEHKVAEQAPKVQFHDDVAAAINCQTVGEVAKELGTGQNRLFRWLRDRGFLMANNEPYQRYVDQGYFKVVPRSWKDRHGELHTDKKTLITGKGLTYFHKLINNLSVDLPANDNDAKITA